MGKKSDYNQVFENVKELHNINFGEEGIIQVNNYVKEFALNNAYYDFEPENRKNGQFREGVKGCCSKCEKGIIDEEDAAKLGKTDKDNYESYYKNYNLQYVSHGSHSIDFLNAAGLNNETIQTDYSDWNDTPVLFLMENPSLNYEIYCECDKNGKWPTNTWYWIHRRIDKPEDINADDYLVQGKYGEMVYALICKNKLSNAYLTNVIKCGLNGKKDEKEDYLGTWWYNADCKKTCINEVLAKEIESLTQGYKRLVVFAFGNNAYWLAKDFLQYTENETIQDLEKQLVLLPHPSSRLNNTFRKVILKSYVKYVLDDNSIGLIDSTPEYDENVFERLYKELKDDGIACRKGNRSFIKGQAGLKYKTKTSLFSGKEYLEKIFLQTASNDTDCLEYGYSFIESSFWVYNLSGGEYVEEYEKDELFLSFKNAIRVYNL